MASKIKLSKEDKLFAKIKDDYKMTYMTYKTPTGKEMRLEVSRKNKKGFYNFVSYIKAEEDFKQVVIQDYYNLKEQEKQKKLEKDSSIF